MNIPGLLYAEDILTEESERNCVDWIDQQPWNISLKRRTQHYGYEYNYRSREAAKPTTPINGPLEIIANWLESSNYMMPQQCIVNEYLKDQSIAAHIDSSVFGLVVISISLLQPCNMIITRNYEQISLCLMPRSILILSGESRTQWKHEIRGTTTVTLGDGSIFRKQDDYRRLSLTYRTLI